LKQRPRIQKDKKIAVFKTAVRSVWGYEKVFKTYLQAQEQAGLWAYARHLSGAEQLQARQKQSNETAKFVVSFSPKITTDLYIEFNGTTYKVASIDPYEYNKTDLEIRAEEISPPTFDEVEYEEY